LRDRRAPLNPFDGEELSSDHRAPLNRREAK
jgi:hypothetical protein